MIFNPPNPVQPKRKLIFLAGTIDNGNSYDWQQDAIELLEGEFDIANPRRNDYDPNQLQSKHNPYFKGQVDWEKETLAKSDIILFNFLDNSRSPISFYELGKFGHKDTTVVVCSEKFYRHGNIDIYCEADEIPMFKTLLSEAIIYIKQKYQSC